MTHSHKSIFIATGLMLFALFFGAGNLIFPALMGQQAGENVFTAMFGFILTGAGLPLLGILAVCYSGSRDVQEMASHVAPWYGLLFSVALYLSIGPLFAAPRTATVSFEIAVVPFLGELTVLQKKLALALFALVFFGVTYWLSISPGKLVDRIGRVLTPTLLFTIAILVITATVKPMGALQAPTETYQVDVLAKGIIEGYGTMDALASLVFAIVVIDAIRQLGVENKQDILKLTVRAGVVAASCLAIVYLLIGYMGATSVMGIGMQENGALVLSKTAEYYFGLGGKILLGIIVFLACLSTAVGLVTSCGEYFHRLCPKLSYHVWAAVFTVMSFLFANFGLSEIIRLAIPVLMLLYPLTVALIALAFLHRLFQGKRIVYVCTILATSLLALFDGWKAFVGTEEGSATAHLNNVLAQSLPLYAAGLGWVLPATIGFLVGLVLSKLIK